MTVVISPEATDDLDEVWRFNARRYTSGHANASLTFLRDEIDKLVNAHATAAVVPGTPAHRYLMIRPKPRANGHVAAFKVDGTNLNVLRVYHTSQDWQGAATP